MKIYAILILFFFSQSYSMELEQTVSYQRDIGKIGELSALLSQYNQTAGSLQSKIRMQIIILYKSMSKEYKARADVALLNKIGGVAALQAADAQYIQNTIPSEKAFDEILRSYSDFQRKRAIDLYQHTESDWADLRLRFRINKTIQQLLNEEIDAVTYNAGELQKQLRTINGQIEMRPSFDRNQLELVKREVEAAVAQNGGSYKNEYYLGPVKPIDREKMLLDVRSKLRDECQNHIKQLEEDPNPFPGLPRHPQSVVKEEVARFKTIIQHNYSRKELDLPNLIEEQHREMMASYSKTLEQRARSIIMDRWTRTMENLKIPRDEVAKKLAEAQNILSALQSQRRHIQEKVQTLERNEAEIRAKLEADEILATQAEVESRGKRIQEAQQALAQREANARAQRLVNTDEIQLQALKERAETKNAEFKKEDIGVGIPCLALGIPDSAQREIDEPFVKFVTNDGLQFLAPASAAQLCSCKPNEAYQISLPQVSGAQFKQIQGFLAMLAANNQKLIERETRKLSVQELAELVVIAYRSSFLTLFNQLLDRFLRTLKEQLIETQDATLLNTLNFTTEVEDAIWNHLAAAINPLMECIRPIRSVELQSPHDDIFEALTATTNNLMGVSVSGKFVVWDLQSKSFRGSLEHPYPTFACCTLEPSLCATAAPDGLRIFDVNKKICVAEPIKKNLVTGVCIDSFKNLMYVAVGDTEICILHMPHFELVKTLDAKAIFIDSEIGSCGSGPDKDISRSGPFLLSPAGEYVIDCLENGGIRVWTKDRCLGILQGHTKSIRTACFIGPHLLATAGNDETLRIWDIRSHECKNFILLKDQTPLCISPDNRLLVTACNSEQGGCIWDIKFGALLAKFDEPTEWSHASINSKGLLATVYRDTLYVRDVNTLKLISTLKSHTKPISHFLWTLDDKNLISAGHDGKIYVWDFNLQPDSALNAKRSLKDMFLLYSALTTEANAHQQIILQLLPPALQEDAHLLNTIQH